MMVIAGLLIVSCSGCSATIGFVFDGQNWNFTLGGEVPQIPLIDYEKELD